MKRLTNFAIIVIVGILPVAGQETGWTLDKSHSEVGFAIEHMAISEVTGRFKEFDITFTSQQEDFADAAVTAEINAASITTDHERRDNHLRSDDFFNAEQYPKITFMSRSFEKTGEKQYKITGDLMIRGIAKPVSFDATYRGTITTPRGSVMGWKATTVIDRFDFGLKWNRVMENVGLVAGKNVTITLNLEFKK